MYTQSSRYLCSPSLKKKALTGLQSVQKRRTPTPSAPHEFADSAPGREGEAEAKAEAVAVAVAVRDRTGQNRRRKRGPLPCVCVLRAACWWWGELSFRPPQSPSPSQSLDHTRLAVETCPQRQSRVAKCNFCIGVDAWDGMGGRGQTRIDKERMRLFTSIQQPTTVVCCRVHYYVDRGTPPIVLYADIVQLLPCG
jgi:hypothetical protein